MGTRPGQKIKMTSLDELLCVPQTAGTQELDVYSIYSFENHPFKVVDDEKMDELVDSIKAYGVLTPIIVRPDDEGTYEMISGHRRLHAAKRVGLTKIPAIVKEMTDDDATIMMVDANIQREEILPSEKAFAYKMKYLAMKRQAGRPKKVSEIDDGNNSSQNGTHFRADEELARQVGESRNNVHRYMRMTELIPELLEMVDQKRVPLNTAVEMSYFTIQIQKWLYEYCRENGIPKWNEVAALRSGVDQGTLTQHEMIMMLRGTQVIPEDPKKITLTTRKLNQYFPAYMSIREREQVIISLLEKWKEENGGD